MVTRPAVGTRRWLVIFTERNGIYIIDLQKTVKKMDEAIELVRDLAAEGGKIVFVGTKVRLRNRLRAKQNAATSTSSTNVGSAVCSPTSRRLKTRVKRLKTLEKQAEDGTFEVLPKKEVTLLKHESEISVKYWRY